MILSDKDIKKFLKEGRITIEPFSEKSIQPASVDLHLDKNFLVFNINQHIVIDVKKPVDDLMEKIVIDENGYFIIHPGEFALGNTLEKVGVANNMVGRLEGKSSLGRLGLIIHATAGYLDPGNNLKLTLELSNVGKLPIKLYYKMPIAQMSFTPLSSEAEISYGDKRLNSKYYGAEEPQASKMYLNFDGAENKSSSPLAGGLLKEGKIENINNHEK